MKKRNAKKVKTVAIKDILTPAAEASNVETVG